MGTYFSSEGEPDNWKPELFFSIAQRMPFPNDAESTERKVSNQVIQSVRVKRKLYPKPLQQREQIYEEIEDYREELRDDYQKCTKSNLSVKYFVVGLAAGVGLSMMSKHKVPFFVCSTMGAMLDFYTLFDSCIPLRDRVDKLNVVAKKIDLLLEKQILRDEIAALEREHSAEQIDRQQQV